VKTMQDNAASGVDRTVSIDGDEGGGWIEPGGSATGSAMSSSAATATSAAAGAASSLSSHTLSDALHSSDATAPDDDEYEDISSAVAKAASTLTGTTAVAPAGQSQSGSVEAGHSGADDDYADLASYVDATLVVKDAGVAVGAATAASTAAVSTGRLAEKSRSYDVSITYDNYYKVPRICLSGYDEVGLPLTPEQMMQDVQQDYANKTAVIEEHPHLLGGPPHVSIHPCRHAATMKRILDSIIEASEASVSGGTVPSSSAASDAASAAAVASASSVPTPTVDSYLFLFLKFIGSVVPTIEYDFTISVDTGSRQR
jgi:ubiquitin-like-conjugating enzyme ATG3